MTKKKGQKVAEPPHTPVWVEDTVMIGGKEITFVRDVSPVGWMRYRTALRILLEYFDSEEGKNSSTPETSLF